MYQTAADVGAIWGDAIRLERHRKRKKQSEVAQAAGLAQATVSEAENGRASRDVFLAIAAALKMDLPGAAS